LLTPIIGLTPCCSLARGASNIMASAPPVDEMLRNLAAAGAANVGPSMADLIPGVSASGTMPITNGGNVPRVAPGTMGVFSTTAAPIAYQHQPMGLHYNQRELRQMMSSVSCRNCGLLAVADNPTALGVPTTAAAGCPGCPAICFSGLIKPWPACAACSGPPRCHRLVSPRLPLQDPPTSLAPSQGTPRCPDTPPSPDTPPTPASARPTQPPWQRPLRLPPPWSLRCSRAPYSLRPLRTLQSTPALQPLVRPPSSSLPASPWRRRRRPRRSPVWTLRRRVMSDP
jgi:hypothetical protein